MGCSTLWREEKSSQGIARQSRGLFLAAPSSFIKIPLLFVRNNTLSFKCFHCQEVSFACQPSNVPLLLCMATNIFFIFLTV
jgi:hypothetical protein